MEIKTVKVRFNKYICETDKAYHLEYRRKKMWIPKKICWDLMVAGNDLHAWAIVPAWKFKEITGNDIQQLYKEVGTKGLRDRYDCQIGSSIEKHIPEKIEPIADNTIKDLKKMKNTKIYLAHPAPFKEVKKEIEEELGFPVKIHPNNNQVAYFEATEDIDLLEIENKTIGYDVIVIPDDLLKEYI